MANIVRAASSRANHFDAHLDDGSSLVLVFHASNPLTTDGSVEPFVTVCIDRSGSQPVTFESHGRVACFSVGTDRCHVLIGDHTVQGDLTCIGGMG